MILRDLDLLIELNKMGLVQVSLSLTSLNEQPRQALEPRTVPAQGRLKVIRTPSDQGIPVRVMTAPIIPGLNSEEIPRDPTMVVWGKSVLVGEDPGGRGNNKK